jgi:hypothetical protein
VILRGLGGDADRDPKDGLVTAHELVAYSALTTPDVARRYLRNPQEPMAFMLGADFSLVRVERRSSMLDPLFFGAPPERDAGLSPLALR